MRVVLLLAFLLALIINFAHSQKFTINKTIQPFYDIIEWKGMGAMLLSKDPSGNNNQIYLTLVAEKDKSIWEQQIAPPKGKYYFISSENARYIYFLRNLSPENGKIYFDQMNSAGNVKNTSVSLSSVIKNLGYDVYNLELKNVVVTDKALVHHFKYHDKKEKVYVEIATFVTHHNLQVYAVELGKISEESIKNGKNNYFQYVGFTEDEICFADYGISKEGKGWNVVKYNSKGKEQSRFFIKNIQNNTTHFQTVGFGTNGAFYLSNQKETQQGLISFLNGKFYNTIINTSGGKSNLEVYQIVDDKWKLINQFQLSNAVVKKDYVLGVYPLNEAMTYKISGNELGDKAIALFLNGEKPTVIDYNENIISNPSRMIISDKKEQFAVFLPNGNLFFDKNQLKTETNMKFELIAR